MRKHLVMKLIYAGTFVLLLLGSAFLFIHPGAGIARAASPQTCGSWNVVSSKNPGTSLNFFNGVAALSSKDVWAVGYYANTPFGQSSSTLTEHWNGTHWRVISSPNPGSNSLLFSVAADASNDAWAVGRWNNSNMAFQTLVEHWDGKQWSVMSSPNVGTDINWLQGVTALAPNNVWAVGFYIDQPTSNNHTLVEHWDGTNWSVVSSPNTASNSAVLNGVVAISAGNIWASGIASVTQTLIEHWNGTKWSVVPSPNPGTSYNVLHAITRVPHSGQLWVVGASSSDNGNTNQTLIEERAAAGALWTVVSSPNPTGPALNYFLGVAAISATDIWAVGNAADPFNNPQTLIEHWDGSSWSIVSSPNPAGVNDLSAVTAVPGTSDAWAVGYDQTSPTPYNTLTEFYC